MSLSGSNMAYGHHGSLDVDPSILARGTPGFSGADLHNMVKCEDLVTGNVQTPTDLILSFILLFLVRQPSRLPRKAARQ